ncbi:unnamed protein product, partial [Meganyctiphanes norvegica]
QSGQRLLLFVFTTLFEGDTSDIKNHILMTLGSNTAYTKSFTKAELGKLEAADYKSWSIPLLYKLLQIACGLQYPIDKGCIPFSSQGQESLESLLHQLKEWQHEMTTNFNLILTREEMDKSLENLKDLAFRILVALTEKVQINQSDTQRVTQVIEYIIKDVKQAVNET